LTHEPLSVPLLGVDVPDCCFLTRFCRKLIRNIVIDIGVDIGGDINNVPVQALDETQRDGS